MKSVLEYLKVWEELIKETWCWEMSLFGKLFRRKNIPLLFLIIVPIWQYAILFIALVYGQPLYPTAIYGNETTTLTETAAAKLWNGTIQQQNLFLFLFLFIFFLSVIFICLLLFYRSKGLGIDHPPS